MKQFPDDFIWGAATSAYQIEGGYNSDGKGPSIWDAFTSIPDKIYQGQTGNTACNHYQLFREDVALMAAMNLPAYRFSISWPRILPTGYGRVNGAGIEFYNRLINALLEKDITPWITLYHWDLPLALQFEKDGWLNPKIVSYFTEYAAICFAHFGDRVKNWITINEPWVAAMLGYGQRVFAPGRTSNVEPYVAGHHLLRAHAAAVELYRTRFQPTQKGRIGISNNCDWREPVSVKKKDVDAAQRSLLFYLGWFADPIYLGDYPDVMRQRLGERLPRFTDKEKEKLKESSDFFGLNQYTTLLAGHADGPIPDNYIFSNGGIPEDQDVILSQDDSWAQTEMQWHIVPWGCRKLLEWIHARYNGPCIILTENGCAFEDQIEDGFVNDAKRVNFLKSYISACHRAIQNGVNLGGYFVWSLMDNFEWTFGFSKRFGIHYVDFKTQKRTPKASARWYTDVIRNNGLIDESYSQKKALARKKRS